MSAASRRVARLFGPEQRALAVALLVVAGAWLFAAVAWAALHGYSRSLDEAALRALRDPQAPEHLRGPVWLADAARDVTALGSHAVIVPLLLATVGFLLLLRKPAMALAMIFAGSGGIFLESALKGIFVRPRPQLVPALVHVRSTSFPSGHALLSAAVYLSIAMIAVRLVPNRRVRLYVLAVVAALVALIGTSRVVLGVHYPTDVVAGWLAGGIWALLCGLAARTLQRHGAVEPPGLPPKLAGDAGPPPEVSGSSRVARDVSADSPASRGPAAPRR
ncbi:MAG TPA: phosphatase PAP2 family protein [Thermoanaerobaculia bacterium]|nr:phosphatase PAP2 family protein [Thermoanaerobaculia bacterium]HXT52793.1 phosphatase PAP2 family protein [Thermoanaerobaculia bacterium]